MRPRPRREDSSQGDADRPLVQAIINRGAVTGTAATAASVFAPHLLARYVGRRTDHHRLGTDYPAAQPSPPSTADVRKGDQCDVIAGQSTSTSSGCAF